MKGHPVTYTSDEEWHELRRQHVSGSEVAAALGVSPWQSPYHLWSLKTGRIERENLDHLDRVLLGRLLEEGIAKAVAIRTGWQIESYPDYLSARPEVPLGGTVDRIIKGHNRGIGVLELKSTGWSGFEEWNASGEAPISYLLQLQAYLALVGADWGAFGLLISGQRLEIFEVERRDSTLDLIRDGINSFWKFVEDDTPPPVNLDKDARVVSEVYRSIADGRTVDLRGNDDAARLCWAYIEAARAQREAEGLKDRARAELTMLMGDAEIGMTDGHRVRRMVVPATPERVAAAGERISGRKSYTRMVISEKTG